jgi:hypothetical protein
MAAGPGPDECGLNIESPDVHVRLYIRTLSHLNRGNSSASRCRVGAVRYSLARVSRASFRLEHSEA